MRRRLWLTLGALLLTAVALGAFLARDARTADAALRAAERAFDDAVLALDDQDPAAAVAAFAEARRHGLTAADAVDGPLWDVAGTLPRLADAVELARAAAELTLSGADLGTVAAERATELLDGSTLAGLFVDGAVELDALDEMGRTLDDLPVAPVRAARDRIEATDLSGLPDRLGDERARALRRADEVLTTISTARAAVAAIGEFAGADGSRTYLIAGQNPAELRGTGGLIGFLTEITFDGGRVTLGSGRSFDADEDLHRRTQNESPRSVAEPVDRPLEFAERYDHLAGGAFIGSVNLDPDLPTVGPVLQALYEREYDRDVDGVILVDPVALGDIVASTGAPLELPSVLDTGGLPHVVPGARIPELLMVEAYDAFEGGGPRTKEFNRVVIAAAFERLLTHRWEGDDLLRVVRRTTARRHVQLFSATPSTQEVFEALGAAGAMPRDDRDLLAVTASNAAPNKADVHVAHRITATIELAVSSSAATGLRRDAQVVVAVENPLRPDDHHDYVTGSSPPVAFGSGVPPRVRDALVRTWLTVWSHDSSSLTSPRDSVTGLPLRTALIHDHRAVDVFLETPSASTTSMGVNLTGQTGVQRVGDDVVYELRLWRQAKAVPDHWDVTISPPAGYVVHTVEVQGGGRPLGMGVGGTEGQQLAGAVEDGTARVLGAVTEDATVRVTLRER